MDTQQKVKLADLQIEQLTKTKKHAHLTDTEVMMLVDETRMYEGVGRMFILQPKGVIHNQLLEKQRIAEEKIKELEADGNQLCAASTWQILKAASVPQYLQGRRWICLKAGS
uniref:Prefoldin subunit 1 n=2 Tax=Zonotrichia TaxID=44387 RepID=A0A8D2NGH1_ZONAL